jgi:hypothetical protein
MCVKDEGLLELMKVEECADEIDKKFNTQQKKKETLLKKIRARRLEEKRNKSFTRLQAPTRVIIVFSCTILQVISML